LVFSLTATVLAARPQRTLVFSVGHPGAPMAAVFAGEYLATASWSNVALNSLTTGLTVAHLPQGSLVTALEASPSGDVLAVATCSDGVKLWDVKTRTLRRRIAEMRECPEGLAFNSDGRDLAVAAYQCCRRDGLEI